MHVFVVSGHCAIFDCRGAGFDDVLAADSLVGSSWVVAGDMAGHLGLDHHGVAADTNSSVDHQ